jgi:hypothetical protein
MSHVLMVCPVLLLPPFSFMCHYFYPISASSTFFLSPISFKWSSKMEVKSFLWIEQMSVLECIKKNLHGLSPRANYTDRATAACRRSDCQLFADRGCHMVSVTDPYGRILGFLDRSPLLFYQVAPQLYSRGWVDPRSKPTIFFSGSAGNRTRASGSA